MHVMSRSYSQASQNGHPTLGPKTSDGADSSGKSPRGASPEGDTTTLAGQYSGPTSAYSFLRRAWRRFGLNTSQSEEREPSQAGSIFSYGDKQFPKVQDSSHDFRLPERYLTAEMFGIYFDFAMPTYRFLHQPTLSQWLHKFHEQQETENSPSSLIASRQAVVLMVLATASLLKVEPHSGLSNPVHHEDAWRKGEPFFRAAQARLASETGKVRLESVQARLAMCLYLLHTSRPNQAWYTFGTTVQTLMALGLHRAGPSSLSKQDCIAVECCKRAFWAASTLDTYLSVILGRPPLIHNDDIDQELPGNVDDDELQVDGIHRSRLQKDRVIQASIFHAKITRISRSALREQYSVQRRRGQHSLHVAAKLNAETAEWKASLPVLLSGAIHPSSLIQIFQRQIVVLELAHAHAVMLINRPFLLVDSRPEIHAHVTTCMTVAISTLDTVFGFVSDKRVFPSFWFTQYATFNALSIVYVWLIQRKRNRHAELTLPRSDDELFQLAEAIQEHLSEATQTNAPSLRYSIILEELQQEAARLMKKHQHVTTLMQQRSESSLSALLDPPGEGHPYATPVNPSGTSPTSNRENSLSWDSMSGDFPLDPDLWLHLDSFPFSDINFEQLGTMP